MGKREKNILDVFNFTIYVDKEMSPGNGEDSFGFLRDEDGCSAAVFDGCGGLGAKKYARFANKSSAYIASQKTKEAYFDWYRNYLQGEYVLDDDSVEFICDELSEVFQKTLLSCKRFAESPGENTTAPTIKGSMCKPFPTTAAILLCDYYQKDFTVVSVWAGDSRSYILDDCGLIQVTVDDIVGEGDALSNLTNDAPLSNLLSADLDFRIHGYSLKAHLPLVTIVATDGCFDYLPSPMHFEDLLLSTLENSQSPQQWRKAMLQTLEQYAGDDFSMVINAYGFEGFKDLKKYFEKRQRYLRHRYIDPLAEDFDNNIQEKWSEYRQVYYRSFPWVL